MRHLTLVATAVLAAASATVIAQTPPADLSMRGGSQGTGKVLTFNELEACIKQQISLQERRPAIEQRQKEAEAERAAVEKESDALQADKANISGNERIAAFKAKMDAFGVRVASYTERLETYNNAKDKSSMSMSRLSRELEREAKALKAEEALNKEESEAINAESEKSVAAFNARAQANSDRAATWNAMQPKLLEEADAYELDRDEWRQNCANRRFREDDDKMIRADLAKEKK